MHQENYALAVRWFRAFNTKDLPALLGLYHEDARHFSPRLLEQQPETGGWIQGKEQMAEWWSGAFRKYHNLQYADAQIISDPKRVRMEYVRLADQEPRTVVNEELDIVERRIKESRVIPKATA